MLPTDQFKKATRAIIAVQCLGMMTGALFQNGFYLNFLAARGLSSAQIALVLTIPMFVTMLAVIPFAYLSDRTGKKKISIFGQAFTSAGVLLLIPAFQQPGLTTAAAFAVMSLGGSLQAGAWLALLTPIIPEKTRGRFFSRLNVTIQFCMIIFSFIISRLLNTENLATVFQGILWFSAITGLLRIVAFCRIPELETPHHDPTKYQPLFAALRLLLQKSPYKYFLGYLFLSTLFICTCPTLFGLLEKDILSFSPSQITLMGTLMMIGGMAGCGLGGKIVDRYGALKVFAAGHIGYAIVLLCVSLHRWAPWTPIIHMSIISLLFSTVGGITAISISAETLALMPKENKSLASALTGTAICCAGALSGVAISRILALRLFPDLLFSIYEIFTLFAGIILLTLTGILSAQRKTTAQLPNAKRL